MANRAGIRAEPLVGLAAGTTRGLEASSSSTGVRDMTALAFEHVLASLARIEAWLDSSERPNSVAPPPPMPDPKPPYSDWARERPILTTTTAVLSQSDPDPPYLDWQRGREETVRHRPILTPTTAVSSQSHLGFGGMGNCGGTSSRGPQHAPLPGASLWKRYRVSSKGYRGREPTAWDNAWGRHDGAGYSDTPHYDQFRQEQPRYDKMKVSRFEGSDAANVNFAATTTTDEAGGFVAAEVSTGGVVVGVPMVVGGDPPNRVVSYDERSDPGGYRRVQQIQPQVQSHSGGLKLVSPDSISSEGSIQNPLSRQRQSMYQEQITQIQSGNTMVAANQAELKSYEINGAEMLKK
ncbi:hypothetical protein SASPL_112972 [Salvia splendens]|uniref:Uncharacterized protein n=1 Tax=Salvia splendens TaxID=180675 RepID=A0A8X8YF96_SALSN|nr:hypothetical protein SASPL_112972 [Salvia splendens]